MLKISLRPTACADSIELFLLRVGHRSAQIAALRPIEFHPLEISKRPNDEDCLHVPREDLISLFDSLKEEMTKYGYLKPPPSLEVIQELRDRIASLEDVIHQLTQAIPKSVNIIFPPSDESRRREAMES